ncbi:MAG: ABC transporter permease [Patescibacteria group bacterium]
MLNNLKKYWRVFWILRKLQLEILFEYRTNFYLWTLISTIWTLFNIFLLSVLVGVKGEIAGWTKDQLFLLTGIFIMLDAFTWSFFYHNMRKYTESIFDGSFDLLLSKPVDSQFMIMVRGNSFNNILRLIVGIYLTLKSSHVLQLQLSWQHLSLFLMTFFASLLMIYLIWFFIATFSIWFERLDNIHEIVPVLRRISQLPTNVYQGLLSIIFTVIVPLCLTTTVPTEILLGRLNWLWIVYLQSFTLLLFLFTRFFYFYSIKKYSGIGQ